MLWWLSEVLGATGRNAEEGDDEGEGKGDCGISKEYMAAGL